MLRVQHRQKCVVSGTARSMRGKREVQTTCESRELLRQTRRYGIWWGKHATDPPPFLSFPSSCARRAVTAQPQSASAIGRQLTKPCLDKDVLLTGNLCRLGGAPRDALLEALVTRHAACGANASELAMMQIKRRARIAPPRCILFRCQSRHKSTEEQGRKGQSIKKFQKECIGAGNSGIAIGKKCFPGETTKSSRCSCSARTMFSSLALRSICALALLHSANAFLPQFAGRVGSSRSNLAMAPRMTMAPTSPVADGGASPFGTGADLQDMVDRARLENTGSSHAPSALVQISGDKFHRKINLLGSTGSIGTQTLDIVDACSKQYACRTSHIIFIVVRRALGPYRHFAAMLRSRSRAGNVLDRRLGRRHQRRPPLRADQEIQSQNRQSPPPASSFLIPHSSFLFPLSSQITAAHWRALALTLGLADAGLREERGDAEGAEGGDVWVQREDARVCVWRVGHRRGCQVRRRRRGRDWHRRLCWPPPHGLRSSSSLYPICSRSPLSVLSALSALSSRRSLLSLLPISPPLSLRPSLLFPFLVPSLQSLPPVPSLQSLPP
eukprot:60111-Rhodomonas_salina.2